MLISETTNPLIRGDLFGRLLRSVEIDEVVAAIAVDSDAIIVISTFVERPVPAIKVKRRVECRRQVVSELRGGRSCSGPLLNSWVSRIEGNTQGKYTKAVSFGAKFPSWSRRPLF